MGSVPARTVSASSLPYDANTPIPAAVGGVKPSPYTPGPIRSTSIEYVLFVTPSPAVTTSSTRSPPPAASAASETLRVESESTSPKPTFAVCPLVKMRTTAPEAARVAVAATEIVPIRCGTGATYVVLAESMTHSGFAAEHRARELASHPLTHLGQGAPPRSVEFKTTPSSMVTSRKESVALATVSSDARAIEYVYAFVISPSPLTTSTARTVTPCARGTSNATPPARAVPLTVISPSLCVSFAVSVTFTEAVVTFTNVRYSKISGSNAGCTACAVICSPKSPAAAAVVTAATPPRWPSADAAVNVRFVTAACVFPP